MQHLLDGVDNIVPILHLIMNLAIDPAAMNAIRHYKLLDVWVVGSGVWDSGTSPWIVGTIDKQHLALVGVTVVPKKGQEVFHKFATVILHTILFVVFGSRREKPTNARVSLSLLTREMLLKNGLSFL